MIEPQDLIGLSEIAELCGVRPSAVTNWRNRDVNFPAPWGQWKMGALWLREDVEAWYADRLATMRRANERRREMLQEELRRNEERARLLA